MRKGEIEGRFDPNFYRTEFKIIVDAIEKFGSEKLSDLIDFSNETWNGKDFFKDEFPYIEISEIDIFSGKIQNISLIPKNEAPSRAKMIVRNDDIIISTTRPSRGAISFVKLENNEIQIASTGFSILRNLKNQELLKEYLFYALRQDFSLKQMEQRSSGGNYPAITTDELKKILIPFPSLEKQAKIVALFEAAYAQKRAKEAEAKALLAGIDGYLLKALGISLPQPTEKKKFFYTRSGKVSGGRLDANTYNTERLLAIKSIENGNFSAKKLKFIVSFPKSIVSESSDFPYIGLENIESNTGNIIETVEKQSFGSAIVFNKNQILFPKLRPYLNKVYLAEFDGVCSTEFHILDSKIEDLTNEFLSTFLINQIVVSQTKYLMSGNTLPRLQTEDIENLLIPLPVLAVQTKIANHIATIRAKAKQLEQEAKAGLEQAKKEVEAMILGDV